MFEVSLELNSGEDHPRTDFGNPTVNPWLDTMDIDTLPHHPRSAANTTPLTSSDQMGADAQRLRYHPRDASPDNPDNDNPRAGKNPAEEWVQSKVRLQEVDYSQSLREELQQSKASLTQVSRQNEELAVCLAKRERASIHAGEI